MQEREIDDRELIASEIATLRAVVALEAPPVKGAGRRGALATKVANRTRKTPAAERGRLGRLEERGLVKRRSAGVGKPTHWLSLKAGRDAVKKADRERRPRARRAA